MNHASYRKHNDGSHNSSTYHKKDGTNTRAILKKELLTDVWESYERNGDGFAMFNTEEAALNHELFEVGYAVNTQVYLTHERQHDLLQGKPVF